MTTILEKISKKIFDYFIINNRYYAIQKGGAYQAKNQYINKKTIENILKNKESFLAYQEDNNFMKWICFDFDINKEFIENGEFEKYKEKFYINLIAHIETLTTLLDNRNINYLLEFSGNRGLHIWIIFDEKITRQDGFIIFQEILKQSQINLDTQYFGLDKFPHNLNSFKGTDKGKGVKIPLSFHQKSKKYSLLFNSLKEFDISSFDISELDVKFLEYQYSILDNYILQNRDELFEKLYITEDVIKKEQEKDNFLNSILISFKDKELSNIIYSLNSCQHLKTIFLKDIPNNKERSIVVGLLGQLKNENQKIGKVLLKSYFMSRKGAIETIIDQRLVHADKFCPPTCDYFRSEYGVNCRCDNITQTPLEFLDGFNYTQFNIFDFTEEIFFDIKNAQREYTKQNDEISLFHTMNNLKKIEYFLIKDDVENFLNYSFNFNNKYSYVREEEFKERLLYSITARDKIITTFAIKVLDSIFYKEFSSRSFGYRFNPSFRQNDIFENWLKQWNIYIKELKTLIYADDFKEYYILKLDLKSFYDSIDLSKLQIELKSNIQSNYSSGILDEDEKNIFFNIIDNLLNFSKNITGNQNKGLPQGPAFARYLAEIYLTSLDSIIENMISREGYYSRYVDDIFIIMPDKESIDNIEKEIIQHLSTKFLSLNSDKRYKGMINDFKTVFEDYIDNTKYFIDQIQKHESTRTKTTIHEASSKLITLVNNEDGTINDKNLSFLYTHLNNSQLVADKKKSLEEYIINEAKGRGSFFNIFWKYYFNNYEFNTIDFSLFSNLKTLKRESFLNSLVIVLNGNLELNNPTLKVLLDHYLNNDLSSLEKLLFMEIYTLKKGLFNKKIIDLIGDEINIYNDLVLSQFSKEIPFEIIEVIDLKINEQTENTQFDYLYNILLFSEIQDIEILNRFSKLFINIINTKVKNNIKIEIEYLSNISTALKYIQILYFSTIFYKIEENDDFFKLIKPIWNNLFFNLNLYSNEVNINKLSFWKKKLKDLSFISSNIGEILPLMKDNKHYELTNGYLDKDKILSVYFDTLIEIIYLKNNDNVSQIETISEIKKYLIDTRKVKYLEWLDRDESVFFPSEDICLTNSIHNNITVLRQDNRILIRLKSNLEFKKNIKYLEIQEDTIEDIFDGEYRTIIYSYKNEDYEEINHHSYHNIFEFIQKIIEVSIDLDSFSKEHFNSSFTYINHFHTKFFRHKETGYPLIPYDGFSKYFIKNNDEYDTKNSTNYAKNILELISKKNLTIIPNDTTEIFNDFKEDFLPRNINPLEFLKLFSLNLEHSFPQTIFELEDKLSKTIIDILIDKKRNFYNFFEIYLTYNRDKDYKYILFDNVEEFNLSTLKSYFKIIENSLISNDEISLLLTKEQEKLLIKLENLDEYKKTKFDYDKESDYGLEIFIEDTLVDIQNIEYMDINNDDLNFISNVGEDNLAYLKSSVLYLKRVDRQYKLVVIPKIIEKIQSIIKNRHRAFNQSRLEFFKNKRTIDDLKVEENFSNAVTVLENHYKNSDKFNTLNAIEKHLYDWLIIFEDIKEIRAMLYVIANHQSFSESDRIDFISNVKSYQINDYFITTLKTFEDKNGTHRLLFLDTDSDVSRSIEKFADILENSNKRKVVFLSDNIVSGSQVTNAFKEYYLNNQFNWIQKIKFFFTNEEIHQKKANAFYYSPIKYKNFKDFRNKVINLKEIVFISVLYTDRGKKNIIKYFNSIGFEGKIEFIGKKQEYKRCVFEGLRNVKNKNIFKNKVQDINFVKENFDIPIAIKKYKRGSEVKENDERFNNRNLIARYNSMTQKRFHIFTLKPKYYENSLFQYRKDKK